MRKIKTENTIEISLLIFSLAFLFTAVICPMAALFMKAFQSNSGEYIGFRNFAEYFSSSGMAVSLWNSVIISLGTSLIAVFLAFVYAYALTRADIPFKRIFRFMAMMPIFAPTMVFGIALIYLIGNKGIITAMSGIRFPLYGPMGIIISEIFYTFPQAFLILYVTLSYADNRLYESARAMGTSIKRTFMTVILPGARFGIISALMTSFTLCFSDFGAPKVVGGNFNVLATDIYKQVVGQQNFGMGAVVGILLMIPAVIMFITDRMTQSMNRDTISSKSMKYRIIPNKLRDRCLTFYCMTINFFIVILFAAVFMASVIKAWPYNMGLTLEHFTVDSPATGGLSSFFNSLITASLSAIFGTVIVFLNAWLIEKLRGYSILRQTSYLFSIIPLALPGLSIGLAFIFFFNSDFNPLSFIYGTIIILILANIVHFYSVPFVTATSALKKLDKEIESVAESMSVPPFRTLARVTVPMCKDALFEIAVFFFVNAMVTISAVVFLYPADFKLASVAIVNMEDAGDIAPAAALSVLVILINVTVRLFYEIVSAKKQAEKQKFLSGEVQQ